MSDTPRTDEVVATLASPEVAWVRLALHSRNLERENAVLCRQLAEALKDTERLDAIASEYLKIEPVDVPTGEGDCDVHWVATHFFQAPPQERELARTYEDDLRRLLDDAIRQLKEQSA